MRVYEDGKVTYFIEINGHEVETDCEACYDQYLETREVVEYKSADRTAEDILAAIYSPAPQYLPAGTSCVVEIRKVELRSRNGRKYFEMDLFVPGDENVVGFRVWVNLPTSNEFWQAFGLSSACSASISSGARARVKLGVRSDKYGPIENCNTVEAWLPRKIRSNNCEHGHVYSSLDDRLMFH